MTINLNNIYRATLALVIYLFIISFYSPILNFNDLYILKFLPGSEVNAFISSTRLSYSFTPQVFLQSLVQYNNVTNITSVNARFGWLKTANTGLFVVLNLVKDTDWNDPLNTQTFSVKYTHQLDVL